MKKNNRASGYPFYGNDTKEKHSMDKIYGELETQTLCFIKFANNTLSSTFKRGETFFIGRVLLETLKMPSGLAAFSTDHIAKIFLFVINLKRWEGLWKHNKSLNGKKSTVWKHEKRHQNPPKKTQKQN